MREIPLGFSFRWEPRGHRSLDCWRQLDKGGAMRNWLETIGLFLLLLLLIAHSAEAQLYVAKTGSDADPCTSALAPCHTINAPSPRCPAVVSACPSVSARDAT